MSFIFSHVSAADIVSHVVIKFQSHENMSTLLDYIILSKIVYCLYVIVAGSFPVDD